MKLIIVGSSGLLGSDCLKVMTPDFDVIAPTRKELDIVSWDKVIEFMQKNHPDIVLNCAAFTDVNACEKESFVVRKVNVEGPRNLAQGSARFKYRFIHISSDYVFNGQKLVPQPYFEDDATDPISAYGKSKVESEIAVRENSPSYIIIRSAWLYGENGDDFISAIVGQALNKKKKVLRVVNDQYITPTWTYRLAGQIKELINRDVKGTYHATAEGYCTPFEYARVILDNLDIKKKLEPCSLAEYPQKARRPVNCILENKMLKKQGINLMPYWKEDLEIFLEKFGKTLISRARDNQRRQPGR